MSLKKIFFLFFFFLLPRSLFSEPLGQIVVSADLRETLMENTAAAVTVITQQQMFEKKARTVEEALRQVPSLDVVSLGAPGDDTDIHLRGSDKDEVLVLVDGMSLNALADHKPLFLGSLPTSQIERIEIIRGSQSVLYGSDAIGGVIHIITKKKAPTTVLFETGNLGRFHESLSLANQTDDFSYSLIFTRTDQAGRFDHDRFGNLSIFPKITWQFDPRWKLQLQSNYSQTNQELFYEFLTQFDPSTMTLTAIIDPDVDRRITRRSGSFYVDLNGEPTDEFKTNLSFSTFIDHTTLKNFSDQDSAPTGLTPGTQNFSGLGYRHTLTLKNNYQFLNTKKISSDVAFGFEFQNETYHYNDTGTEFPAVGQEGTRQNYAPFLLNNIHFFDDRVILSGGFRFDHNTTFGSSTSPRFSGLVHIWETGTTLRANYGEGFHGPTLLEFFNNVLQRDLGLPFQAAKLKPELSQSYEAGIEQQIADLGKMRITFFRINYDQLFDALQDIHHAHTQGLELETEWNPWHFLSFGGDYTLQSAINEDNQSQLTDRPKHQAHLFFSVKPIKRLQIRHDLSIVSSRPVPNTLSTASIDLGLRFMDSTGRTSENPLSSYVKADLTLDYQVIEHPSPSKGLRCKPIIDSGHIFAKLNNLFDASYEEKFGFPAPGINFRTGFEAEF